MEAKLLKTSQAEYVPNQWNGVNESGFTPLDDKVMILPDVAASQTSGGVFIPDEMTERHTMASETGIIVAIGEGAFVWNTDRTAKWTGLKPSPGDRVYIQRYAGQLLHGKDGNQYRVMDYKCIGAIENA